MLILTRKRQQSIQIGDNIVLRVLKTGRSTVQIGIEAPREIRILRDDVKPDSTTPQPVAEGPIGG